MRPIRCIKLKNFKFKTISITEDSTRFVVRILTLLPKLDITKVVTTNSSNILTTLPLLNQIIELDGKKYQITGEGIFDLQNPLHKRWWKPMANIQFVINPATFYSTGVIDVVSKRECSFDNGEKSPDWTKRLGYYCLSQIYVRSANDSITETAKSFPQSHDGMLFTNLDISRLVYKTEKDMVDRDNRSRFLGLDFNLRVPASVLPNSEFKCQLEIYRGSTLDIATECDGDYWNVESSAGYIPNRKIKIKKGKMEFTGYALLLKDSDMIEVTVKDLCNHVCAQNVIRVKNDSTDNR